MRVTVEWLEALLKRSLDPKMVTERLTAKGIEGSLTTEGATSIFEFELTPNRGDCASVRGLAREIAALSGEAFLPDYYQALAATLLSWTPTLDPNICTHYRGALLENIGLNCRTPDVIVARLSAYGIKPIHCVVDCLNYVMLETGQPLHAFDADTLTFPLTVREGLPQESLTLLDGRKVSVKGRPVIADAKGPQAIAGIMGGLHSMVTSKTRRIFVEAARFVPNAIMGHARTLGLKTDASFRFERGIDGAHVQEALAYAVNLLQQHTGATVSGLNESGAPEPVFGAPIPLNLSQVGSLLGITIERKTIYAHLSHLGFKIQESSSERWEVLPPAFRNDIAIPEDIIEEIGRTVGYDSIPPIMPYFPMGAAPNWRLQRIHNIKQILATKGLNEAVTYSFLAASANTAFSSQASPVVLQNPITAEYAQMRLSLLPNLLDVVRYHQHRQIDRVRLFEVGHCYTLAPDKSAVESMRLAMVVTGNVFPENWHNPITESNLYTLQQLLLDLMDALKLPGTLSYVPAPHIAFLETASFSVHINGTPIGIIGKCNTKITEQFDMRGAVWGLEVALEPFLSKSTMALPIISKFPSVRRDLAMVVPEALPLGTLIEAIENTLGPLLSEKVVFDMYQGKGVPQGYRSVAIGLILQDPCRTLVQEEVDTKIDAVQMHLKEQFGVTLRT